MLRYKAEQPLPPHTISRFIVRHHQEIKNESGLPICWRYGVILEDGKGSIALAREKDRVVSVSVKGPDKTDYIDRLRETLNDIFNSYKSEKPDLEYRVERYGQIPDQVEEEHPLWLPDIEILKHSRDGRTRYDHITGQDIPLDPVVEKYNISVENLIVNPIYNIDHSMHAKNLMSGGQGNILEDRSKIFNFRGCNIDLQGNLNDLAQLLGEGGHSEEAKELEGAAKALEQAEQCGTQKEVRKKGILNRIKRLVNDLGDDKSQLGKYVKGIRNGVSIAQDIAKGYNSIAQWVGLPTVPKPFLNNKK